MLFRSIFQVPFIPKSPVIPIIALVTQLSNNLKSLIFFMRAKDSRGGERQGKGKGREGREKEKRKGGKEKKKKKE